MTPRIHLEREVTLEIELTVSSIAGEGTAGIPIIANREIKNTVRLKDGETNLLAGLLRDEERRSVGGITGLKDIPLLGNLFSARPRRQIEQTDVVLTITPHIIREIEITEEDAKPLWVDPDNLSGVTGGGAGGRRRGGRARGSGHGRGEEPAEPEDAGRERRLPLAGELRGPARPGVPDERRALERTGDRQRLARADLRPPHPQAQGRPRRRRPAPARREGPLPQEHQRRDLHHRLLQPARRPRLQGPGRPGRPRLHSPSARARRPWASPARRPAARWARPSSWRRAKRASTSARARWSSSFPGPSTGARRLSSNGRLPRLDGARPRLPRFPQPGRDATRTGTRVTTSSRSGRAAAGPISGGKGSPGRSGSALMPSSPARSNGPGRSSVTPAPPASSSSTRSGRSSSAGAVSGRPSATRSARPDGTILLVAREEILADLAAALAPLVPVVFDVRDPEDRELLDERLSGRRATPMTVKAKFFAYFRDLFGGRERDVAVGEGATVGDALDAPLRHARAPRRDLRRRRPQAPSRRHAQRRARPLSQRIGDAALRRRHPRRLPHHGWRVSLRSPRRVLGSSVTRWGARKKRLSRSHRLRPG